MSLNEVSQLHTLAGGAPILFPDPLQMRVPHPPSVLCSKGGSGGALASSPHLNHPTNLNLGCPCLRCGKKEDPSQHAPGDPGECKSSPPFAEYFPLHRYSGSVANNRRVRLRGLIFDASAPNPVRKRALSCQFAPESAKSGHFESTNMRFINKMTQDSPKNQKGQTPQPRPNAFG